jgi:hypothetical protein
MKTFIASTLLLLAVAHSGTAQQVNKTKGTPTFGKTPDYLQKIDQLVFTAPQSLVLADQVPKKRNDAELDSITMRCYIEGKKDTIITVARSIRTISQYWIKSMELLKDDEANKRYGEAARKGIILMTLAKGAELLNLIQLFNKYNISKKDRQLPLYVDGLAVNLPQAVVFTSTSITAIKKTTAKDGKTFILNIETAD